MPGPVVLTALAFLAVVVFGFEVLFLVTFLLREGVLFVVLLVTLLLALPLDILALVLFLLLFRDLLLPIRFHPC